MTTNATASLTNEQLSEVLQRIKGADSCRAEAHRSGRRPALRGRRARNGPARGADRQVVFFDTPDLALNQHGVVLRARPVQGEGDDSVLKLRPVVPRDLAPDLRKSPSFGVEVDAMPGGFVCSGS